MTERTKARPVHEIRAEGYIAEVEQIRLKYPELFLVGLKLDRGAVLDEHLAESRKQFLALNNYLSRSDKTHVAVTLIKDELGAAIMAEENVVDSALKAGGRMILRRVDKLADLGLEIDADDTAYQVYSIFQFSQN